MDAWGGSWGAAWGDSWGAIDIAAPLTAGGDEAMPSLALTADQIRQQNDLIMWTVIAAVTGGLLE